jgi:molecular chaperone GrpE
VEVSIKMNKKLNTIFKMNSKKKAGKKMNTETKEVKDENAQTESQQRSESEVADEENDYKTPAEKTAEPKDEKTELEIKVAELNDKLLRLYSDYDNYRKRTLKEKIELSKMASEDVIVSLLPIMDDFERAIKSMNEVDDVQSMKEGIDLIYNKFKTLLNQKGVEDLKSEGEVFNTDFHEAITNVPAETDELKGKIVEEVLKGYSLNGKVIRFAKVVVAN